MNIHRLQTKFSHLCLLCALALRSTAHLYRELRAVGLVIAEDKQVAMSASAGLAEQFAAQASARGLPGFRCAQTCVALGADFGAGGAKQGSKRRQQRLDNVRERGVRLRTLRAAGARTARFFKQGSLPAGLWAVDTNGISNTALRKLRRLAGSSTSTRVKGRTLELDLACADVPELDPAFSAHARPAFRWATAIWEAELPLPVMEACCRAGRA